MEISKKLSTFVVLLVAIITTIILIKIVGPEEKTNKQYDYELLQVFPSRTTNECFNEYFGFRIKIKFEEIERPNLKNPPINSENLNIIGVWQDWTDTIILEETSMTTVVHEAYHATQTMLERYDLQDNEEYGAYLQGYLSTCVTEIVENELRRIKKN